MNQHACPHCDALFQLDSLNAGSRASCGRCGHHLTTEHAQGLERATAFALSALILLAISATHPFLSFAASGREVSMTLLDTAITLFAQHQNALGLIVFLLIFAGPLALLLTQLALQAHLLLQRPSPWVPHLARALHALKFWNMIEVFLVSVFVSAAKLNSMAVLSLGVAFYSFVGFTLCTLAAVHLVDDVQLWRRIERLMG